MSIKPSPKPINEEIKGTETYNMATSKPSNEEKIEKNPRQKEEVYRPSFLKKNIEE